MGRQTTIDSSAFYIKVENYLKTISHDGQTWDWLESKLEVSHESVNNWRNGYKTPSLDTINRIACILKDSGVNIWTPKLLITDLNISLNNQVAAFNNIKWLCNRYNISAADIYNETKFELPKNSVLNVLNKGIQPNFENLEKFYKFFKAKRINLSSISDLIYFPVPWAEKEDTFQQIRDKIKII